MDREIKDMIERIARSQGYLAASRTENVISSMLSLGIDACDIEIRVRKGTIDVAVTAFHAPDEYPTPGLSRVSSVLSPPLIPDLDENDSWEYSGHILLSGMSELGQWMYSTAQHMEKMVREIEAKTEDND